MQPHHSSVGILALIAVPAAIWAQPCTPQWSTEFDPTDLTPSGGSPVVFDEDGPGPGGPVMYLSGGDYNQGSNIDPFARRVNGVWQPVGGGLSGGGGAAIVYDDGAGPALLVLGSFTAVGGQPATGFAKWDGHQWAVLPGFAPQNSGSASQRIVFDEDGSGPGRASLFVGGGFSALGTQSIPRIARWDGKGWTPVGGGVSGDSGARVAALCVFDDGSGEDLYVGGRFSQAGGVAVESVARWTGTAWEALGGGFVGSTIIVNDFHPFDLDGPGPLPVRLIAGGDFDVTPTAPTVPLGNLAQWTGTGWEPIGGTVEDEVNALQSFDDDGPGPRPVGLYVAGDFTDIAPAPWSPANRRFVRWDENGWSTVGGGIDFGEPRTMMPLDEDGPGPAGEVLLVFGSLAAVNGSSTRTAGAARWDGSEWTTLDMGMNDTVRALAMLDEDGPGPTPSVMVAAGEFQSAGNVRCNGLARRVDDAWTPFGAGIDGEVRAVAAVDLDNSGPRPVEVFAGGIFDRAGGVTAYRVASWNGSAWSPLGGGIGTPTLDPTYRVNALAGFDEDGAGLQPPRLFAGGQFVDVGALSIRALARWDGSSWSAVGEGVAFSAGIAEVFTLLNHDDGTGPCLWVGGAFSLAGGQPASRVARWDGQSWSNVGTGMNANGTASAVHALAVHEDGTGSALYAGGTFETAGGVTAPRIARWNGQAWSAVGTGIAGMAVRALASCDLDGPGPLPRLLAAGGTFTQAGGKPAMNLAVWNGSIWAATGTGTGPAAREVYAALGVSSTIGDSLLVGGSFTRMDGVAAARIARMYCAPPECYPDCNSDGTLNLADFGCFQTKIALGDPYADCNGDAVLNLADFGCFQTQFALGCP